VVASRRILFQPAFRVTVLLTVVQLFHTPVEGNPTDATLAPLTFTLPGRLVEPLAKRHCS
jgi:hypothetical protein